MVTLMETGAYLVNGTEVVADTAEAAALIKNKTGLDIVKEEALKNTIAYGILESHNTSDNMDKLRIKFDKLTSHDITFVGIIQTARASGLEKFPIPYVLTNCHNSLCAVGGTINEDDHMYGLTCAKKYGGVYVPPHQAVIHQFAREMLAGGGKMILGSDSHTRYGALGTMAVGEGGPELVKQLLNQTYDIDNVSFDLRILSGVNTLSSLTVSDYDFDFNSNIFEYYLEVPTEVSEITISGITTDENATVTGIGTESLDYGTNNFDIVVISESGVKKTYNLIVNRTETVIFNDKIKEDRENNRLYIVIDRTESLVVNTLLDKMETIANLIVTNNKGVTMSGTDKVGTGSNVKIDLSNEALNYKIVVLGDTTGDGKVNVIDVTKLYQQYRGTIETQMSDVEIVAGDVMKDNVIKLNDIAKLYQYVQGTYPTLE